jgi:hypothetical protein
MGDAIVKAAPQPTDLATSYGEYAGAGFDNQTSEDMSIPFLGVLQALSPELQPGAQKIKGAEVGNLINTVTKELFDGEKNGVVFQPADTNHVFVEWKPRNQGGGFVAVHQLDSEIVASAKAKAEKFGKYKTDAGNDLIETFYIAGLLHRSADLAEQVENAPEPMIVAFTSTKIKAYKQIMTRLRTFKGKPPLFAHRLLIKTWTETNAEGTFANFTITPAVNNDVAASLIPPTLGDQPHPLLCKGRSSSRRTATASSRSSTRADPKAATRSPATSPSRSHQRQPLRHERAGHRTRPLCG